MTHCTQNTITSQTINHQKKMATYRLEYTPYRCRIIRSIVLTYIGIGGLVCQMLANSTTFPHKKVFVLQTVFLVQILFSFGGIFLVATHKVQEEGCTMRNNTEKIEINVLRSQVWRLISGGQEKNTFGVMCDTLLEDTKKR